MTSRKLFQFHKGSIRTYVTEIVVDEMELCFNSIKVQLELRNMAGG